MTIDNIKIFQDSGKVDIALVEAVEKKMAVLFPSSYKQFICHHNNAYLTRQYFEFFRPERNEMGVSDIFFFGFGFEQGLITYSENIEGAQSYDVYGFEGLVTFASNSFGDYICFDYRDISEPDQPKITFMSHDEFDDETDKMLTYHVAENFDEFCGLLYQEVFDDEE